MRLLTDGAESGDISRLTVPGVAVVRTFANGENNIGGAYSYGGNGNLGAYVQVALPSTYTELYIRIASIQWGDNTTLNTLRQPIAWLDSSGNVLGSILVSWPANAYNPADIEVYVGGSQVAILNVSLPQVIWRSWEVHLIMSSNASIGKVQLRIDGDLKIDFTGATGATAVGRIGWAGWLSSGSVWDVFDDIAVNDTSGGTDTSWCGNGFVVVPLTPNGAGNYTDLLSYDANPPYANVQALPATGTYVYESTINLKSTYAMTNRQALRSDYAVRRVWVEASAKSAAAGSIATLLRSRGTDAQGTDQTLTTSYVRYLSADYFVDPSDSSPWRTVRINGIEAGVILRASTEIRIQQVLLQMEIYREGIRYQGPALQMGSA